MLVKILVIADTDIDGAGTATIIRWYYQSKYLLLRPKITVMFPEREVLNEKFADETWVRGLVHDYDIVYLCDTGLNTNEGNKNLGEILAPMTIYLDHHQTNYDRQEKYIKNFKGFHVKEGARCSAKIAFDTFLKEFDVPQSFLATRRYRKFVKIKEFAQLINDFDMWIRKYPRSTVLNDIVAAMGPQRAYEEFVKICLTPGVNTEVMKDAITRVRYKKLASLELGKATLVKHRNYKVPFYTAIIAGFKSEVGSALVHPKGMVAVFDIESRTVSFRIGSEYSGMKYSRNTALNCLDFAELFGGGGHPQAAGIPSGEAVKVLKNMSREMGRFLLEEEKNERQRKRGNGNGGGDSANRAGNPKNTPSGQRGPDKS
jgi:oligoribonuclease NrnB/cAMP/cGMP phosphodiesterase (DHH superfamily)